LTSIVSNSPASPFAETERGKVLQKTEAEVKAALQTLVLNGGQAKLTAKQLKEQGMPIKEATLRHWKSQSFPRLYMQIRKDLSAEVGEEIAGRALERALEADQAEQIYIEKAVEKADEVEPNFLAKNALALAQAKGQNIERAQTLRHEPSQIIEVDVHGSIETLERLGVVEKAIDAEVVEEDVSLSS
jgi:hypothetical protein